jgi:hypothetical protein
LRKAEVTYADLAKRLRKRAEGNGSVDHQQAEARDIPGDFVLAMIAALELEGLSLKDI